MTEAKDLKDDPEGNLSGRINQKQGCKRKSFKQNSGLVEKMKNFKRFSETFFYVTSLKY